MQRVEERAVPDKSELISELNWISERISNRVWTISVGVLAFCVVFIIEAAAAREFPFLAPARVVPPIVLTLLAMLCDLVQYVAGYSLSRRLLKRMEREKKHSIDLDQADLALRVRFFTYWGKLVLCGVGVAWLVVVASLRTLQVVTGGS